MNKQATVERPEDILWGPLALVCLIVVLAIVAQVNFAPVLPIIQHEFVIASVWGGVIASATMLSHTMLQIPGGHISNILGGKRALTLGLLISAIAVLASGVAPNYVILLAFRFILGIGTAITFIGGMSCANTLGPRSKATIVQGFFGSSASIGILVALLTSERLANLATWRGMFLIEGAIILAVAFVGPRLLPSIIAQRVVVTEPWVVTFRQKVLYVLGLAHVLTYGVHMAAATWVAVFLWQQHGVGLEWAGPLGAFLAVSGVLGRTVGGRLSVGRERLVITGSCFATAVLLALLPIMPGLALALADAVLLGWFANIAFGAIFAYVTLVSDKGVSGREFGIINFVGNLGALAFPPLIGYALDVTGSFLLGLAIVSALCLIGSVFVITLLPKAKRQVPSAESSAIALATEQIRR